MIDIKRQIWLNALCINLLQPFASTYSVTHIGLSPNQGTFTLELSYPSAQINKSAAAAITPLGQVPHLPVAANRISYSCGSARQLAALLVHGIFIPILFRIFPESRETHLRCIRCRPRGLSRTFYLPYDVGVDQGAFHPAQTIVFTHIGDLNGDRTH